MKTLIICGGQPPSKKLLEEELIDCNFIICADKGGEILYNYGIKPDLILGDFDSISKEVLEYYKAQNILLGEFPPEKDFTDSYAALEKAIEIGSSEVGFLGCTGSRMDHVLGNLGLLLHSLNSGLEAYIRDDKNIIKLTNKPQVIRPKGYNYFSLISYGSSVTGITLKGAKYPLNNYNLKLGESLGISNEFEETEVNINFKEGLLLIIQSNE